MNRTDITYKLRESLLNLFEDKNEKDIPNDERDQSSIQNELDKPLAPSKIAVCAKALGMNPKDAGDRSKCVQKIDQKHGQGLSQKEADDIAGVVSHTGK